jgi:hypothetical protein
MTKKTATEKLNEIVNEHIKTSPYYNNSLVTLNEDEEGYGIRIVISMFGPTEGYLRTRFGFEHKDYDAIDWDSMEKYIMESTIIKPGKRVQK